MAFSILMIDDNKDLLDITCELLNIIGYKATAALSGEGGISIAKEIHPQVILCDIGMAGMNGYDVARSIRQDNELKSIYLIAMSGYSSQEDVKLSIEAGFNKHLCKPVNIDTLITAFDELL